MKNEYFLHDLKFDIPFIGGLSYGVDFGLKFVGMEGVDKEKVQRTVYEMSKGSKYFENEERKDAYMKQKIENMRIRCAKLSSENLSHYQKVIVQQRLNFCQVLFQNYGQIK